MSGEKCNNEFDEFSNPKRYHYENEEKEELQNISDLYAEIQNNNQLENKVDDTSNSVLSTLDETNKKTSSTENLKHHLKSHPDKFDLFMAKQAEFMKIFLQEDDQPFTVVESDEFHDLIKLCNPMNSTYLILQCTFKLWEPLEEITAIDRELEEFTIFTDEWEIIKELCCIFEIFHKVIEHMFKSNFITLSSSIPVYNVLLDHLEKLLDTNDRNFCPNLEVRNALRKGYKKLKVYYAKTDDSYVYPIATSARSHFSTSCKYGMRFLSDSRIKYTC
ncbi:hypothetical protein C1646_676807 [Rhizophagus diaphanus]|nr:hypothetical protein C1646_676807 [Rhizophagus diaphanus] [Rhizophagus sp. MUCL 43196]